MGLFNMAYNFVKAKLKNTSLPKITGPRVVTSLALALLLRYAIKNDLHEMVLDVLKQILYTDFFHWEHNVP